MTKFSVLNTDYRVCLRDICGGVKRGKSPTKRGSIATWTGILSVMSVYWPYLLRVRQQYLYAP